ncbi:MAG TPA: hypothetical protein VHU82_01190 [Vicinamibacterales bacterium]|jgi:hypothetical protein|nr:hypothetical protein [Vicinamibacterales bacterium]
MAVLKVPKTPIKAFNKERRPSALLLSQIAHLEWAALPASQRKPGQLPTQKVRTEAQAAERIGQLTAMVLAANQAPTPKADVPAAPPKVKLPPIPRAPASRSATGKTSTRKRAGRRRPLKRAAPKRAASSKRRAPVRRKARR